MPQKQSEHTFSLRPSDGQPEGLATLRLLSDAPSGSDGVEPILTSGSSMHGVVRHTASQIDGLPEREDDEEPQPRQTDVVVTGNFSHHRERTSPGQGTTDSTEFLHIAHTISNPASEDERSGEPSKVSFDVQIPEILERCMPYTCSTEDLGKGTLASLPKATQSVRYNLRIHFRPGKKQPEKSFVIPFQYAPSQGETPSSSSQRHQGKRVRGPREDPGPWGTPKTVSTAEGDVIEVAVERPPIFVRGTPITMFLSVSTNSAHSCTPPLCATLRARHSMYASQDDSNSSSASNTEDFGPPVFRWSESGGPGWVGEIAVPSDARVSCDVGCYRTEYAIMFYDAQGTQCGPCRLDSLQEPILEVPVEIAPLCTLEVPSDGKRAPRTSRLLWKGSKSSQR